VKANVGLCKYLRQFFFDFELCKIGFKEDQDIHFVLINVFVNNVCMMGLLHKYVGHRQERDNKMLRCLSFIFSTVIAINVHFKYILFDSFFYTGINARKFLTNSLQYICCTFGCFILFVCGKFVCLILHNFNRCLTFVILWCVEEYFDMHQ
jgi:hypothetical protein